MASLKQQMQVINKLIKAKRFDEARDVLMTVNNKKAKQVLAKINKQYPEVDTYIADDEDDFLDNDDEEDLANPAASVAGQPNYVFITLSLLLLILIIGGGLYAVNKPVELLIDTYIPGSWSN